MDRVKAMVRAGVSVGTAIREASGLSVAEFARKHGLQRTTVNSQFTGRIVPDEALVAALVAELGGTGEEWYALPWSVQQRIRQIQVA